jgi:hypothetical protein
VYIKKEYYELHGNNNLYNGCEVGNDLFLSPRSLSSTSFKKSYVTLHGTTYAIANVYQCACSQGRNNFVGLKLLVICIHGMKAIHNHAPTAVWTCGLRVKTGRKKFVTWNYFYKIVNKWKISRVETTSRVPAQVLPQTACIPSLIPRPTRVPVLVSGGTRGFFFPLRLAAKAHQRPRHPPCDFREQNGKCGASGNTCILPPKKLTFRTSTWSPKYNLNLLLLQKYLSNSDVYILLWKYFSRQNLFI